MSKTSRRRGRALGRVRGSAARRDHIDRRVGVVRRWRVITAVAVASLGIGMAGFAAAHYTEERLPSTSDLSDAEIIDAANAAREQLEVAARALADEGQLVDRATAAAQAEARLETMEDRYWQALEGMRPGIDPDLLGLVEQIPRRGRELPSESRDELLAELQGWAAMPTAR